VRHVNIKDSVTAKRAACLHLRLCGEGQIRWPRPIEVFARQQFTGCVSLEWEKLWHRICRVEHALDGMRKQPWFQPARCRKNFRGPPREIIVNSTTKMAAEHD